MLRSEKEITSFYNQFHQDRPSLLEKIKQGTRIRFLRKLIEPLDGRFLVVGCGSGDDMTIFQNKKEVVGIDISKVAIDVQKKRFPKMKFLVADAQNLPFDNESFDCVVCSEVIEHLPDDRKFIDEAHRVLRKRGILIITTPNWYSWYGLARKIGEFILKRPLTAADQPIDHWYTPKELKRKLKDRFKILGFWGLWYFPPTGKGRYKIPDYLTLPFIILFYPLEWALKYTLPKFGHSLVLKLERK